MAWLYRNSDTDIFLANFRDFDEFFVDGGFQSYLNSQRHFQIWYKVINTEYLNWFHFEVYVTATGLKPKTT